MNIESFINIVFVNLETGYVTDDIENFLDGFFQTMQDGLSDNGWTLPQQPTTEIAALAPIMPNGTMWYDETTDQFKVLIAGVVKVVTVT